jgi:hypothetical protein
MRLNCPCCATEFPIEAGMIDADGKRLAAIFAAMEPTLGRATIGYLRLFKPAKTALRTARAIKIVADLDAMVRVGSVCRDERGGLRRPATAAHWAAGIEQILIAPPNGLPLTNHHYLRAIVYGLADQADAVAERSRETVMRAGTHRAGPSPVVPREDPLTAELAHLKQIHGYGRLTDAEYQAKVIEARARFAPQPEAARG